METGQFKTDTLETPSRMVTEVKVDQSQKLKIVQKILSHNLFTENERNLDIILKDIIL